MAETGRIVAIIGGIIGIVFVLLSLAVPILAWYRYEISGDAGSAGLYLTAFGTFIEDDITGPDETASLVMIGGIMVLAGGGLCILAAAIKIKVLAILGGILMIVGPLMLIIDLVSEASDFSEGIANMADYLDTNVFFGSYSYSPIPGYTIDFAFGLWVGFFMPFVAGVIGIIGGASM